ANSFAQRLCNETGTRLIDWIDHLAVPGDINLLQQLNDAGFVVAKGPFAAEYEGNVWQNDQGIFPLLVTHDQSTERLVITVESIETFYRAHQLDAVEGEPLSALRKTMIARQRNAEFWAVERHGGWGWQLQAGESNDQLRHCEQMFCERRRTFDHDAEGFEYTLDIVRNAIDLVGVDRACDLFFAAERDYWQSRNQAARIQRSRQDALGLGWANHDHHTYRSSRESFASLITVFEQLGCRCRERFYAGAEAGWGAQVLEQPQCGIVIFADVDLTPDELSGDFAHQPLLPLGEVGTVGLWCKLHGEAFFQAGMHHLECQFDFDAVRQQLKANGIESMAPFTDFAYLKQAFTEGEIWSVDPQRIEALRISGLITDSQADQFSREGTLGSHLEILQRDDGFKGFNQTGVSQIIRKTDPRVAGV
ncbi:MAG: hypothetical protein N2C12_07035, partial [Planctomycetales bacterium]